VAVIAFASANVAPSFADSAKKPDRKQRTSIEEVRAHTQNLEAASEPSSGTTLPSVTGSVTARQLLCITLIRLHPVAGLHWHQCWRYHYLNHDERIGAGHSMMTVIAN